MKLTELSIARPMAVIMIIIAMVLMGIVAHARLGVGLFPNVNIPYVEATIAYPGASPTDVETLVTKPVEDAVAGLTHVKHITSVSTEGLSIVSVEFTDGTDGNKAATDVERAITGIRSDLPSETLAPTVARLDFGGGAIMYVTLSGNRPTDQLFDLADKSLKPKIKAVDGVASITYSGDLTREIDVQVDPAKMRAYHISLGQVTQALQQGNQTQPSGAVDQGSQRYDFRVIGEALNPADLGNIVVASNSGGPVHLADVATVSDTFKTQTVLARANGHDAIVMAIHKQDTANTVAVATKVRKVLADYRLVAPAGVDLEVMFDTSIGTQQSVADVNQNLIAAIVLTGVVLLLFLHNFRSTVIVLLAIPTSLISTFAVMYLLGFTLNLLSLMAMALLIGILVDDSIVVLENIARHFNLGEAPRDAALRGRSEIGMAAIAITLVDVVVYTPIAYMQGWIGAIFREFGLTITAATLFSLAVSFTLTPILASRWLKRERPTRSAWSRFGHSWDGGMTGLSHRYSTLVGWVIARTWRRWMVVGMSVLALFSAVALVPLGAIGTEFVPPSDEGMVEVDLQMPAGTSLDGTNAAIQQIDTILARYPEVATTMEFVGNGGRNGATESRFGSIYVQLTPKNARQRTDQQFADLLQAETAKIPGAKITATTIGMSGGGTGEIDFRIQGDDLAELTKIGDQTAAIMAAVPGTKNVRNQGAANLPEIHVETDQNKLANAGLTTGDVAFAVRTALQGTVATKYKPVGGTQVDVRVQLDPVSRANPEKVLVLPILAPNGNLVTLGQVATMVTTTGPSQITRNDRQRQITVSANPDGRPLGDVTADIRAGLKKIDLPPGYSFVEDGDGQAQTEAFTSMVQALAVSVVLIYMLMVVLYESFTTPLVIMFSLPMALVGAFVALAVTGDTLNVFSMIGLVTLMGLVAKNAILLVDYTKTLRKRGMPRDDAVREAGKTRLRPILMTTCAMVLGMLPLAFKIGAGSEARSSMGVVLIGGLISSLLLTLVLVPSAYTLSEDTIHLFARLFHRLTGSFGRGRTAPAAVASTSFPQILEEALAVVEATNEGTGQSVLSGVEWRGID